MLEKEKNVLLCTSLIASGEHAVTVTECRCRRLNYDPNVLRQTHKEYDSSTYSELCKKLSLKEED